jgi:hypothetical protein
LRFNGYLPVLDKAVRLRIRRGDTVLWERARPTTPPQVEITRAQVRNDGDLLIAWQAKVDAATVPEVWLQWRPSESREWRALLVGVREDAARIPLDCLLAGDIHIRVLLHDGFSTASAESVSLQIPARAPQVGIINPVEGSTAEAGSTMLLWGYATDCEGKALPGESLTWRLNRKVIGAGRTFPLEVPATKKSGLTIELEAKDQHGTSRAIRSIG